MESIFVIDYRNVSVMVSKMLQNIDLLKIKSLLRTELSPIKKDISKIREDINMVIEVFDNKDIEIEKRLTAVESKVGIFR